MKKLIFLLLVMVCPCIHSQKTMYNIKDFGAVSDGVTLSTGAINGAIEKCSENGGGMVVIPAGTFKSGMILMKSNVELHLEMGATLLASADYKDYPAPPQSAYRSLRDDPAKWIAFIYAEKASNIAITGLGTIDGNGTLQKPLPEPTTLDMQGRPHNILFISCNQVRVEGIRMRQSGMWNQHYLNCEDVIIDRIEVYNHSNRNNDAIDIDGCRRVVISNSIVDSDDDGITLKSTGPASCEDITITNCVASSFCNAIKMGTESTGGFRNIAISNCVVKPSRCETTLIYGRRNGISGIALEIVDGGIMEGIAISNMTIEGTESPLFIRLGNRARKHNPTASEPPVGKIRHLSFSNIIAYNTGLFPVTIMGLPGHCIENVTMDNIQIFNKGGLTESQYKASLNDIPELEKSYPDASNWGILPASTFFIRHAKGISIHNLMFGSQTNDPRIPIIAVDVERLRIGKSMISSVSSPPFFVLLDGVKDVDIEKPLGWGGNPIIKQ